MNQNDLPIEVVLHRIGPCPICGKGQMLQGTAGWTCDYFRTIHDKCTFTIFSSYSNYLLTEEDAVALIRDGRTMKHNFMTQSSKGFVARLVLEDGKVKVVGENRTYLSVVLPVVVRSWKPRKDMPVKTGSVRAVTGASCIFPSSPVNAISQKPKCWKCSNMAVPMSSMASRLMSVTSLLISP